MDMDMDIVYRPLGELIAPHPPSCALFTQATVQLENPEDYCILHVNPSPQDVVVYCLVSSVCSCVGSSLHLYFARASSSGGYVFYLNDTRSACCYYRLRSPTPTRAWARIARASTRGSRFLLIFFGPGLF
jgi:hypothetical protein